MIATLVVVLVRDTLVLVIAVFLVEPSSGLCWQLRWIQFGAVAPILRTHCDHCERRVWLFPHFPQMKVRIRSTFGRE